MKDIIIRGDAGFGISTIIDILYSQRFLYGKENEVICKEVLKKGQEMDTDSQFSG